MVCFTHMKRQQVGLVLAGTLALVVFVLWKLGALPSFEEIRTYRDQFAMYAAHMPVLAPLIFGLLYVIVVALSVPLATPLSLLSGFLFGAVGGTVIVVVSATIGATIIFVLARYFFRDYFEAKVSALRGGAKVTSFGTMSDVLVARLIPAVPFSLINVVSGLTTVSLRDYVIATFFGIIPFAFVYVYAGQQLGEIDSIHDIASTNAAMFLSRFVILIAAIYVIGRIARARAKKNRDNSVWIIN